MEHIVIQELPGGNYLTIKPGTVPDIEHVKDPEKALKFMDKNTADLFLSYIAYHSWLDGERLTSVVRGRRRKRRTKAEMEEARKRGD